MYKIDSTNCIVNFSNSILKKYGVTCFHKTINKIDERISNSNKIALFLFDGMGKVIIEKHLKEDSFIRKNIFHTMTSTMPPTTVASTNALLSGKFPIETGWIGWTQYFKEIDENVNVFPNTIRSTNTPASDVHLMNKYGKYDTIADLINKKAGYNAALLNMGYPVDKSQFRKRFLKLFIKDTYKKIKDKKFIYSYWVNPDGLMHHNGINDKKVKKCINKINKYIEKYSQLNKDVTTIVIADHGMIDVNYLSPEEFEVINQMLLRPISFEPRFTNFFVKDEYKEIFKTKFEEVSNGRFELYTKKELLDNNILGDAKISKLSDDFIGDFVSISTSNCMFSSNSKYHKSHHAGGSKDEMEIAISIIN